MGTVRILQIFRNLNMGGSETLVMNLYRNIDREKVQFDFLVSEPGYYDEEVRKLGGNIYKIDYITKVGQFQYEKQLKQFFTEHIEYRVVHSHIDQVSGIVMQAAKKAKVPVRISHSHSTNNTNNWIYKIYKKYLQKKITKNATNFFACSEEAAQWLFGKKIQEKTIINNGVDTSKFVYSEEERKNIRKELNLQEDEIVWGHVGSFLKVKNHEFLIEVFSEYIKLQPKSKLVLVGEGVLRPQIEEKVKMLNLQDKVLFLGKRTDVSSLCSAFDIYVFPSLYEGISTAMIEAQAEGLKVFTSENINRKTNVSGTMKFIPLQLGAIEWAKMIHQSDKSRNKDGIQKIKQNGYDIKETAKNIEEQYIKLYNQQKEGI